MISKAKESVVCKVIWSYNGFNEEVSDMRNKSRILCKWWVRCHLRDQQYAAGTFRIVPIVG